MLGKRDATRRERSVQRLALAHREARCGKPRAAECIRRLKPEARLEGGAVHDPDVATRRWRSEHARARMQLAHTAEGSEKDVMVGRVLGDQNCTCDAACSVDMLLERRIPKELRIVLPANRKADRGCARI